MQPMKHEVQKTLANFSKIYSELTLTNYSQYQWQDSEFAKLSSHFPAMVGRGQNSKADQSF